MPLSEHEQRELEQIERYLAAEDPKFVSSIRNIAPKSRYKRRIVLGCIGFILGVALLLAGVANAVPLSIAGFVLMFASMVWVVKSIMNMQQGAQAGAAAAAADQPDGEAAGDTNVISFTEPKRQRSKKSGKQPKPRKSRSGGAGFMDRIEARWLRRRDRPWY
ncbi:MAG: DUF3040 domain-containing protein [Streptosporangiales bacterium]|nr:DUF3040 domain-containing protein [Streptosporangiales bacterium]